MKLYANLTNGIEAMGGVTEHDGDYDWYARRLTGLDGAAQALGK